jgi:hypothetical protein
MKGKTETAIEYYALVFDSGEKKLFSSDGVRERIRKARGAASIGTLTDSQILALFDDIERNHWGWNFSTGGFTIGFISSQQIPVGSSGYISLQLLLGRKLDKRNRLHEMLNKSVRIADCIRAVCGVKDESAQPIESASADYPRQVQALTGVGVSDTVEGHQEDIEDSDGSVPNVNVTNTEPIPVRDSGVAKDMLWALTMVDHPDEKIRHWAKSQSGVGNTDIAKSENPTWEQEFGEAQANEMWASEGERIRMQVRSVDNMLSKRNNPTKWKKAK